MSKSRIIYFGLLLAALAGAMGYRLLKPASSDRIIRFQVQKGLSARLIARDLRENGVLEHPWSFLIWVRLYGAKSIRPGVYDLPAGASGYALYRRLIQGPPQQRITFPEGWTARQMAALLETRGIVSAQDFLTRVEKDKREGFLFPDTYLFDQGLPAERVIERMTVRFNEKVPKDFADRAKAMKLSTRQLVTLASIVEREARVASERPLIAGVFLNRLKKHWYLESCATVEYALGSWKTRLTYKDLEIKSPYNTYRHLGLPPGPIANPGAAALEAAAHPAVTDMMFFVADGQGTHRFSRYYKEHLAAQGKRRAGGDARGIK